ncbi:hypothetical protein [Leptospira terpstrae]|nr:hypothetical protein [Leptospira terpstrae]
MYTNNYCTLFDSNYLLRGITMLRSLVAADTKAKVYVFPFDKASELALSKLHFDFVQIVTLEEFESIELLKVKEERSKGEYCWTCTPWIIKYSIEKYKLDHCTYVDADLFFYSNPEVLFGELKNSSVLITEHRYSPEYDQTETAGKYCVQFVFFRNDANGKKVLDWWADRCLEWCYARFEDGKFGDQKYLDHWTSQFEGVHVLKHLGGGVAPWNIQQYDLVNVENNKIQLSDIISKEKFPLVFYHFHDVKMVVKELRFYSEFYQIHESFYDSIYKKYSSALDSNLEFLEENSIGSEKVPPILLDLSKTLNYYKAIKLGFLTETVLFIAKNGNINFQNELKYNFPISKKMKKFRIEIHLGGFNSPKDMVSGITIVPARGTALEMNIVTLRVSGLDSDSNRYDILLQHKQLKKMITGNWQKRNGNTFCFYSSNGFFSIPLNFKTLDTIELVGDWRFIDPIESALEISKLSLTKRILKKLGY